MPQQHAAEQARPALAEPVDQLLHRCGVEQAADREGADDQPTAVKLRPKRRCRSAPT